jgi:hypothetical protein
MEAIAISLKKANTNLSTWRFELHLKDRIELALYLFSSYHVSFQSIKNGTGLNDSFIFGWLWKFQWSFLLKKALIDEEKSRQNLIILFAL